MDDNFFETQRCAILSHACSRVSFCSVCVVTHCAHLYMLFEWVFCSHASVGCLEVFLQATETGPNSEKCFHESSDHEECLEFQLLVFQLFRSQFVDEDDAVCRFPRRPSVEPPTSARVDCTVIFFNSVKRLSFSLSYLLASRNGSICFLGPCQVLVMQSFALPFRLNKVGSLIEWLLRSFFV